MTVGKLPSVFKCSLCVVDFPGLNDCGVIEEKRAEVLKAFRAYTTGEDMVLTMEGFCFSPDVGANWSIVCALKVCQDDAE